MNGKTSLIAISLLASAQFLIASGAQADTFSTLITTPLSIEGLTGDNRGNLYVPGRTPGAGVPCPVWRVNIASPSLVLVGNIPAPTATTQCSPSGLAFDRTGRLYVTETDRIYRFIPNDTTPPTATVFATGVPGTNGLGFDTDGNLWTGDGTTGLGRVWKIGPAGGAGVEMFRVQPMVNVVPTFAVGAVNFTGVGRDARTVPTGNSQPLVANGVAFTRDGDLLIADTARGAVWRVQFESDGTLRSKTGCDTTFLINTLCLENILVTHPLLDGIDGFVLDEAGNIWADANERNAIVVVTNDGRVTEVFRNDPDPTSQLRNLGPLETPTSPYLSGRTLCTSNSDGNRRDNAPNTAGEINPAGPDRGKISCMNELVNVRGLPLPIR
jgi:sugar lactone lactonase YvrE